MTLERMRIFGNPNIGVYIYVNNKIALIPPLSDSDVKNKLISNLGVEVIECRIADTNLIGILVAGNDNGLLLPRIARDEEVEVLQRLGINVKVLYTNFTALGNVILSNNKGAVIHPEMNERDVEVVKKVLGVSNVVRRDIGRFTTVGSIAVVNDVGGLIHPDVSDDDVREVSKILNIRLDIGTVNFGVAFIKAGLVANNYGAVVGERTTGPEIMRIIKALNIGV